MEDPDHHDFEIPRGWPLGLETMNASLRLAESSPAVSVRASAGERHPLHIPGPSFSSFSSSNLDTESSSSFFQDHSVSLGRLIGIRICDRRHLCVSSQICFLEGQRLSRRGSHKSEDSKGHEGICIPFMVCTMIKTSRSKSKPMR